MFSTYEITVILLTLKVAIISTLFTLPLAIWLGWVLATKNFFGKLLVEGIISIPLVAPPVVTGYLLLILLQFCGINYCFCSSIVTIGGEKHQISI